jgi:hypothetical protein
MLQEKVEYVERSPNPSVSTVLSINQNLEIQRNENQYHQDTDRQIGEDWEEHRSDLDVGFNTSESLPATRSQESGSQEGIPR